LRKLLIGIAVLVVVLVAAVLVVPGLIDWNGYKPEIQAAARDATGRELRLQGDIGLSVLPSPSLSVENVTFANVEGGSEADMVSLESLRVHVALLPLLSGRVHVTSVTLVKPIILLERLADGRANWEFPGTDSSAVAGGGSGSGQGGGDSASAVSLDSATIEGGTLVYRDAAAGTDHRIEGLNATVSATGLKGPFEIVGSLDYQGLPLSLEMSMGRLDGQRPSQVRAVLSVAEKALTATVTGSVDQAAGPAFSGEASIEAPDLGTAIERLSGGLGGAAAPAVGAGQKLMVTTKISGSPKAVTFADLAVVLGESRLQGSVAVALDDVPTIDAKLSGNRLDLDALMPAAAGPAAGSAPAGNDSAPAGGKTVAFALPTGIAGSVDIAVDALQYKGASIRKARLAGDLVDGAANLRLATAQLPGGTEVTVTGTATSNGTEPQFIGRLEAVSDNLRGTLEWAGVDTTGVATDRLRKASIRAAVDATPRKVEITDWTMELDTTKAKGGLTLVVRDRPAFGLSLEIDRLDVDAYLPAAGGGQPAQGGSQAGAATGAATDNPLAALNAVDANVNIKVGEATALGFPVRDARIDALLQNGVLTLRDVGVADLGGAKATVAGVLRNASGKPSVDLKFDVTVINVERFAKLLSTESPISAKQLGQVSLKGTAAGDMQDVKVDVKLTAAGGSFGVKGTAKPLASPPGLDLALVLSHPDTNKLAAVLAPGALDGVGALGALEGTGTIRSRDDGRYANRIDIAVAGGAFALVGNAAPFAKSPDVDMAVEVVHADAVKLIRTFAPKYRPAGKDLGGLKVRTRFKGPVDNLQLFETEIGLGAIKATGDGGIDSRGARPKVTLALAANTVAIDPWLPPSAPKPASAVPAVPVPAGPAAPSREWSRERIDISGLSMADADLKASIASIVYGSYVVDNAQLAATLKDGVLDLSKLAGGMFGGTFDMSGRVADRPAPAASIVVKVRDADVRKAAQSAANTDMVSGILTYDTDLKTQGTSEFELVSALAGTGSFSVRDGVVKGFDLKAFSGQLKALDRAPDFVQLAQKSLSGGETRFSSLTGTYTVAKGVLRSNDIKLQAEAAAGTATAVVDLPPQQMDVKTSFRLSEHPGSPPVGVRLVGPLDNPRRIFEIEEMQAHVIQRLVERGVLRQFDKNGKVQDLLNGIRGGTPAPAPAPSTTAPDAGAAPAEQAPTQQAPTQQAPTQQAPTQQPAEPQPIKPEDAVRGLLKGLLR